MRLSSLLKDTVVYGFTSYLSLFVAFFLTPVYTRILTKEEYGVMDLFTTWNNIFILLVPLGLSTAILRQYSDFDKDVNIKTKYLGTLLTSLFVLVFFYIVVMYFYSNNIFQSYYKTKINMDLYYLSISIVSFTIITSYFQALNRIQFKKYVFASINIINFIILSVLGFYWVAILKIGILGFFLAASISSGASFLFALIFGYKNIKISFDSKILKSALRYSIPLLFVLIFIKFTHLIDRYIINSYLNLTEVGEYSIVLRVNNVFQLFIGAFTTAWFPFAMDLKDSVDRNANYQKAFKLYLILFASIASLIILFSRELFLFFAPSYLNVLNLIYLIIPATFIGGTAYFFGLGIHIKKTTEYFIYSSLISFIINFSLSWILVKHIGLYGIAIGTLVSVLVWVLIDYLFSYKLVKIKFSIVYLFYSLLGILLSIVITFSLNYYINSFILSVLIKTTLLIAIFFYLYKNKTILKNLKAIKSRKRI